MEKQSKTNQPKFPFFFFPFLKRLDRDREKFKKLRLGRDNLTEAWGLQLTAYQKVLSFLFSLFFLV